MFLCMSYQTCKKTAEAVDHDKQGTNTSGLGQLVAARDAIWNQLSTPLYFFFVSSF